MLGESVKPKRALHFCTGNLIGVTVISSQPRPDLLSEFPRNLQCPPGLDMLVGVSPLRAWGSSSKLQPHSALIATNAAVSAHGPSAIRLQGIRVVMTTYASSRHHSETWLTFSGS